MISGFSSGETKWTDIRQKGEVGVTQLRDINSRHTTPSKFSKESLDLEGIGKHQIILKGKGAEDEGVDKTMKKDVTENEPEEERDQMPESKRDEEMWE